MRWGPMWQPILLGSQNDLLRRFFQPSNLNGETWYSAWSYLAYGSHLQFVRAGDVTGNTVEYVNANNTLQTFTAANNVILLNNTAGIAVGMKLFYSNSTALSNTQQSGVYVSAVNSSSVTLTSAPTANANAVTLIFRSNVFYSAVGQETQTLNLQWATYNVLNANQYSQVAGTFDPSILWVARYPGLLGNSIKVSQCDSPSQFVSNTNMLANTTTINATATFFTANIGSNTLSFTVKPADTANATHVTAANTLVYAIINSLSVGDLIQTGNSYIDFQFMQVTANSAQMANTIVVASNVYSFTIACQNPYTLIVNSTMTSVQRYWQFYNLLGTAPGQSQWVYTHGNTAANDQMHIVVVDQLGQFTGDPGAVLEVYKNVSRAIDAQNPNSTTNYYANVVNQQSRYIWFANDRAEAKSANAAQVASSTGTAPLAMQFFAGDDGLGEANVSIATIANGYSFFQSPSDFKITSIITGKGLGIPVNSNTQLASYLINNISSTRRDCVVFCSPDIASVVNNVGNEAAAIVSARNVMPSSSYAFMDSGYKLIYDLYNNVYRWCPLNGDTAGLEALTQQTNGPWWSPAGFNRGNIKNVVQLAFNPDETERDTLYPAGVNPVVRFPGQGTVLYGDKTLFAEASAFSRINVRELFIYLEQSIVQATQTFLFEFNDAFTRAQYVSMVQPFLQQVKSLRGLIDYRIRCDATNNPAQVVQSNQMVADFFILPNYSINWIKLNFVGVPPTMSFSEAESVQF